jgi:hypothetical protein
MDKYNSLLNSLGGLLKDSGYVKKGNTFYLFKNSNWGILDFQKSRDSTNEELIFTLNVCVVSSKLRKLLDEDNSSDRPEAGRYHWRSRIGLLMQKGDFWWKLNDSDDINNIIIDVAQALMQFALPTVEKMISDVGLINAFKIDGGGNTEIQRYIYLTTLLKLNHDSTLNDYIDEMLETFTGKSYWSTANDHIRFLNSIQ